MEQNDLQAEMMSRPTSNVRAAILMKGEDGQIRILTVRENTELDPTDDGERKLPGGKVEEGETPREAVANELAQELGVAVRFDDDPEPSEAQPNPTLTLALVYDAENEDGSHRILYTTQVDGPDVITPSDEISEVAWMTEQEIAAETTRQTHSTDIGIICYGERSKGEGYLGYPRAFANRRTNPYFVGRLEVTITVEITKIVGRVLRS